MALTITLKRNGVSRGSWSATDYSEAGAKVGQARAAGEIGKRAEGGTWTIEFSGSTVCGTCGKTKPAPGTITI